MATKTNKTQFLKESLVTQAVARKEIKLEDAKKILSEAAQTFSKGQKVYVGHGIYAGSFGTFLSEGNGGYANVDIGAAGKTYLVPLIYLYQSQNKAV